MSLEQNLARLFGLTEERWARHANPWSGWSRLATGIPAIILSVWSRVWIGWWALLPIALTILWLWLNPRLFPPARDDRNVMTRGVLGERLWVERRSLGYDELQSKGPVVMNIIAGVGAIAMVVGLWRLDAILTLVGGAVAFLFKFVFILMTARMYERVVSKHPEHAYGPRA